MAKGRHALSRFRCKVCSKTGKSSRKEGATFSAHAAACPGEMVVFESFYNVIATDAEISDGTNGGCIACGEVVYGGTEPDARGYDCEACGTKGTVYGLEELAIMNMLEIEDGDE